MNTYYAALRAEFLKIRHSRMSWVTFLVFSAAPIMGGVFMLIMQNPDKLSGTLAIKTKLLGFSPGLNFYLGILNQSIGVGGIMIFGFVASWIFGREYSDGTAKDLLALPVSRTTIVHAKFTVYIIWCFALAVSNFLIGIIVATLLGLPGFDSSIIFQNLSTYSITTVLALLLGPPIGFFALWGKGYLAPLGFVAATLVFAQVIGSTGYGNYFPWSIPGLYSGSGGIFKSGLNYISFLLLGLTCIVGYISAVAWWKYADQHQ